MSIEHLSIKITKANNKLIIGVKNAVLPFYYFIFIYLFKFICQVKRCYEDNV